MVVSGEAWRPFKENNTEQDFSDFWLQVSLKFSISCFDLSSFLWQSQRCGFKCLEGFEDGAPYPNLYWTQLRLWQ
jgi:hypothetical protein